MSDLPKPPKTIAVTYDNGEIVHVKRVKPAQIDDLILLQKSLLNQFLYHGAMLGEVLKSENTVVWADLKRMASLLPIVGSGSLDLDRVDDWDQLCALFFTASQSEDEESGAIVPDDEASTYRPSEIARLHGLNFWRYLLEQHEKVQTQNQQERLERLETLRQAAQTKETPSPTSALLSAASPS